VVSEQASRLALYLGEDKTNFSMHHCFITLRDFLSIVESTKKVCFQKLDILLSL